MSNMSIFSVSRYHVNRWPVAKQHSRGPKVPGLHVWTPSTAWLTGYEANTAGFTPLGMNTLFLPIILFLPIFLTSPLHIELFNPNPDCDSKMCPPLLKYSSVAALACHPQHLQHNRAVIALIFRQSVRYLQMHELFTASASVTGCDVSLVLIAAIIASYMTILILFQRRRIFRFFLSVFHQRMRHIVLSKQWKRKNISCFLVSFVISCLHTSVTNWSQSL